MPHHSEVFQSTGNWLAEVLQSLIMRRNLQGFHLALDFLVGVERVDCQMVACLPLSSMEGLCMKPSVLPTAGQLCRQGNGCSGCHCGSCRLKPRPQTSSLACNLVCYLSRTQPACTSVSSCEVLTQKPSSDVDQSGMRQRDQSPPSLCLCHF